VQARPHLPSYRLTSCACHQAPKSESLIETWISILDERIGELLSLPFGECEIFSVWLRIGYHQRNERVDEIRSPTNSGIDMLHMLPTNCAPSVLRWNTHRERDWTKAVKRCKRALCALCALGILESHHPCQSRDNMSKLPN
jgi:hypothetical protein